VLVLLCGLALAFALPSAAQETVTTDTAATQTGSAAPAADDDLDNSEVALAVAILAFGAIVLALALWFLSGWRTSYQALASQSLERTGVFPVVDHNPVELQQTGARGAGDTTAAIRIRGPAIVFVGRPATFTALQDDTAVRATWSVAAPSGGAGAPARVEPAQGEETKATASRLGPVTIRAAVGAVVAEAHATAVAPPARRGSVPLIGGAYGGITIAITGLTIAGMLTALDKLDGAALAALLGSIVGYFFVGRAANGDGSPRGSTAGSGADEGGSTS
jgi:hypothetical protein